MSALESRFMSWNEEGELFNELQWFANGDGNGTPEDRALIQDLINRNVENTHEEPDGLGLYDESIYKRLTEEEIDSLEERLATVQITWMVEDWALADRVLGKEGAK